LKSFRPFDDVQNKVIDESIADGEAYKVVTDRLIRLIRWIGSGAQTPDDYCFPGNLIRWIYLAEKELKKTLAVPLAPSPMVQASEGEYQESFVYNYVKPYAEIGMIKFVQWLHETTKGMEGENVKH
jgi:hypothetical protein